MSNIIACIVAAGLLIGVADVYLGVLADFISAVLVLVVRARRETAAAE